MPVFPQIKSASQLIYCQTRYAHLKPEAVREAVAVLDRLQSHSGHTGSEVNAASNVVTLVKS